LNADLERVVQPWLLILLPIVTHYTSPGSEMLVVVSSRLVVSFVRDKRHKYAKLLAITK
jgi:hypothetical protein